MKELSVYRTMGEGKEVSSGDTCDGYSLPFMMPAFSHPPGSLGLCVCVCVRVCVFVVFVRGSSCLGLLGYFVGALWGSLGFIGGSLGVPVAPFLRLS